MQANLYTNNIIYILYIIIFVCLFKSGILDHVGPSESPGELLDNACTCTLRRLIQYLELYFEKKKIAHGYSGGLPQLRTTSLRYNHSDLRNPSGSHWAQAQAILAGEQLHGSHTEHNQFYH